ncbi:hypothetical protein [Actinomadura madurae]|uniref:hypothetical protein n=1 Tax=Actinomadura madurae TaxID=1993 RepID=UPI0015A703D3|nr:hypothetical protein [Actinomadura madurae]
MADLRKREPQAIKAHLATVILHGDRVEIRRRGLARMASDRHTVIPLAEIVQSPAGPGPPVIKTRGPYRSSARPTGTPASAATMSAAVMVAVDQPVSRVMAEARTGKA